MCAKFEGFCCCFSVIVNEENIIRDALCATHNDFTEMGASINKKVKAGREIGEDLRPSICQIYPKLIFLSDFCAT